MNNERTPNSQEDLFNEKTTLDLFLDGLLDGDREQEFLSESSNDAFVQSQRMVQGKIDDSLKRMFASSNSQRQALRNRIEQTLVAGGCEVNSDADTPLRPGTIQSASKASERQRSSANHRTRWIKIVLTASLLAVIGGGLVLQFSGSADVEFKPISVAKVFQDKVDHGFRPYYNCEDMVRFANTFETRHGKRLTLAEMPANTKMLGISYLGGLSRGTTTMLGTVNNEKVMVFVDSAEKNQHLASVTAKSNAHPETNIFVTEKYGLVFVEVSTLKSAQMTRYMVAAE